MKYAHLCSDGVIYVWEPIKPNPRACPRDKARTDSPYIRNVSVADLTLFFSPHNLEKYKKLRISISGTIKDVDNTKALVNEAVKQSRKV